MDADVGIIGLGTMGSMAMWQLARKRVSVIGFEQSSISHNKSVAGGDTRIFRTAYKEGVEYVPLLKEAYSQWLELERETGDKLLTITKGLMIGNPGLESMMNVILSIQKYGLDFDILTYGEVKKEYPQHQLLPEEVVIIDKRAGYIRSQHAIISAVLRAIEMGAAVIQQTKVEEIEEGANSVTIVAKGKKYKVGKVLLSMGPWINEVFSAYNNQIEVRRLIGTWFSVKNRRKYSADRFPVFTREFHEGSIYGIPSDDGKLVHISLLANKKDRVRGRNELDKNVEQKNLAPITHIFQRLFPELCHHSVRTNTYMEAYTIDRHPIIGKVPGYNHIYMVGGFSGQAFKMAPAIGKMVADILIDGKSPISMNPFTPDRLIHTNIM